MEHKYLNLVIVIIRHISSVQTTANERRLLGPPQPYQHRLGHPVSIYLIAW